MRYGDVVCTVTTTQVAGLLASTGTVATTSAEASAVQRALAGNMANLAALDASVLEFTLLKSSVVDGALAREMTYPYASGMESLIG
jgi:hypothetical protein